MTRGALRAIARAAMAKGTGTRGLRSILEALLHGPMYEVRRERRGEGRVGCEGGRRQARVRAQCCQPMHTLWRNRDGDGEAVRCGGIEAAAPMHACMHARTWGGAWVGGAGAMLLDMPCRRAMAVPSCRYLI